MEKSKYHVSWFGVALILFGAAMLLSKLHIFHIEFMQVFWSLVMLVGISKVTQGFSRNYQGKIFWGTVFFLAGLFFLLHTIDTLEIHQHMLPSALFLILGIAFSMTYLNNVRQWHLLIPALVLGGIGTAFVLAEFGYLSRWDVWEAARTYWPLALILLGLAIILRKRMDNSPKQTVS